MLGRGGYWPWTPETNPMDVTFAKMMEEVRRVGFDSQRALAQAINCSEATVRRAIAANGRQWDLLMGELRRGN